MDNSRIGKVKTFCYNIPAFPTENLSDYEEYLADNKIGRVNEALNNSRHPLVQRFRTASEVQAVLTPPKSYHDVIGVRRFEDMQSAHVNTAGGHRVTLGQPAKPQRAVYLMGGCTTFGYGSTDEGTSASHLQKLLNELAPEQGFIVHNYGFYLCETDNAPINHSLTYKIFDCFIKALYELRKSIIC